MGVLVLAKKTMLPIHWSVAARLPLSLRRHYLHTVGSRRLGNFASPETFNEKINWRIIHDRRPQIVDVCDKLRMKDRAVDLAADDTLSIPRTLWCGTELRDVPDDAWRQDWVLKPNHSSGKVIFGPASLNKLLQSTHGWLETDPGVVLGEWGYERARRMLLLEERILAPEGIPKDYKFYVFDGVPRMIQVNAGRFENSHTESYFDSDWRHLPLHDGTLTTCQEPRPVHLDEMLHNAATLGAGWDFIRVDFYDVDGTVWFGEFTPYPGGGVARWRPRGWDHRIGSWWTLPALDSSQPGSMGAWD